MAFKGSHRFSELLLSVLAWCDWHRIHEPFEAYQEFFGPAESLNQHIMQVLHLRLHCGLAKRFCPYRYLGTLPASTGPCSPSSPSLLLEILVIAGC